MKNKLAVKAMPICQEFRFPAIWTLTALLSNQTYVLQVCLITCETEA